MKDEGMVTNFRPDCHQNYNKNANIDIKCAQIYIFFIYMYAWRIKIMQISPCTEYIG